MNYGDLPAILTHFPKPTFTITLSEISFQPTLTSYTTSQEENIIYPEPVCTLIALHRGRKRKTEAPFKRS